MSVTDFSTEPVVFKLGSVVHITQWTNANHVNTTIFVKHWVLILICTTFAIVPWASSVPYLRRFSLRTLLIATTLVAAGLGIIAMSRQAGFLVRGAVG
jgi:hypothetical protein